MEGGVDDACSSGKNCQNHAWMDPNLSKTNKFTDFKAIGGRTRLDTCMPPHLDAPTNFGTIKFVYFF